LLISALQITQHWVFSVYFHQSLIGNGSPQWLFLCNVLIRRFLVTNLSNGESSASVARWLTLHSWTLNWPNSTIAPSFLSLPWRAGLKWTPQLTDCSVDCPQDNSKAQTPRKTLASVVKNACLLAHYLAVDVLLLRAPASGIRLPSCCLAMGICITILYPSLILLKLPGGLFSKQNVFKSLTCVLHILVLRPVKPVFLVSLFRWWRFHKCL
jgi:hypothetical protein